MGICVFVICRLLAKSCPTLLGKWWLPLWVLVRVKRQSPVLGTERPRTRKAVVTPIQALPSRPWRMARGTAALLRVVCLYKEKLLPLTRRVRGYEVCPVDTLVEKSSSGAGSAKESRGVEGLQPLCGLGAQALAALVSARVFITPLISL